MADGTEIATLSNVAAALDLSRVTSVANGTELVTLSNMKAILDKNNAAQGPNLLNKGWDEIASISDEIKTIGVTAFREKYMSYLGAIKFFQWQKTSYDAGETAYVVGMAMIVGIGQDVDTSGNPVGFTFLIISSPSWTEWYNNGGYNHTSVLDGYHYDDWFSENQYSGKIYPGIEESLRSHMKTVSKTNGYATGAQVKKLWIFSAKELGATFDPEHISSDWDRYTFEADESEKTYDAFTSTCTNLFARNSLYMMTGGEMSLNAANYSLSVNRVTTSTICYGTRNSTRYYFAMDIWGNVAKSSGGTETYPLEKPIPYYYDVAINPDYNVMQVVPIGFCI